jgi:hypothetical protein
MNSKQERMIMTLEQLITYLWWDMPLAHWARIAAAIGVGVGGAFYLEGKRIMRANSSRSLALSVAGDGSVSTTETCAVGADYEAGRSIARWGLSTSIFAMISFYGFMNW